VVGRISKKAPAGAAGASLGVVDHVNRAGIACDAGTVATLEEKVLKRSKRRKWRRMRANRAAI